MKMKSRYELNKASKVGDECICPSCGSVFIKTNYQQAFCKTQVGTICKDKYWNTVTPSKRNNTTRISPASARWLEKNSCVDLYDYEDAHPFSSDALGQWND
jgi:hypothetical protein